MEKDFSFKMPTEEEWAEIHRSKQAFDAPNCITTWFPPLYDLMGHRVPRTEFVYTSEDWIVWSYGELPSDVQEVADKVREACDRMGYPCFVRSGHTSGKHGWKNTCYIENRDVDFASHLYAISEAGAMGDLPTTVFAIREFLPTEPAFTAFHGDMPIAKEFRFFVRDGVYEHHQPYWPPLSVEGQTTDEDWSVKLASISQLNQDDLDLLVMLSERIGNKIGGYWSIDWLWTIRGWYVTDMAEGDRSYRWEPK